jgi:hypothetical protein
VLEKREDDKALKNAVHQWLQMESDMLRVGRTCSSTNVEEDRWHRWRLY